MRALGGFRTKPQGDAEVQGLVGYRENRTDTKRGNRIEKPRDLERLPQEKRPRPRTRRHTRRAATRVIARENSEIGE